MLMKNKWAWMMGLAMLPGVALASGLGDVLGALDMEEASPAMQMRNQVWVENEMEQVGSALQPILSETNELGWWNCQAVEPVFDRLFREMRHPTTLIGVATLQRRIGQMQCDDSLQAFEPEASKLIDALQNAAQELEGSGWERVKNTIAQLEGSEAIQEELDSIVAEVIFGDEDLRPCETSLIRYGFVSGHSRDASESAARVVCAQARNGTLEIPEAE